MSRVSVPRLVAVADGMGLLERMLVETVARLTLLDGRQLLNLCMDFSVATSSVSSSHSSSPSFSSFPASPSPSSSEARVLRRILARLVEQRVLERLERRRGGRGGGSSAWVYALGPAGRRIVAYWVGEGLPRSRSTYEPSVPWTAHTLAVSDLYVRLKVTARSGRFELVAFDGEPACWRSYTRLGGAAGVLKPDAYVEVGSGEWIDAFFVEVDLGSEHRGQLIRQHRAYREYFRSGVEQSETGAFPSVVWIVPDERRVALLTGIHGELPAQDRRLFTVVTREQALTVFCGETGGSA
jgi:Replication-relaxation